MNRDTTLLILVGLGLALWASSSQASLAPDNSGDTGDSGDGGQGGGWDDSSALPTGGASSSTQPADGGVLSNIGDWVMGTFGSTRGLRNNNPGNLRAFSASQPTAGGFRVFPTVQAGLDEMARQLLLYARRGLTTVRQIVSTYAPSSENNTAAYITAVSVQMGVPADQALNLADPFTLANLMAAMIHQEQGSSPFDLATLQQVATARIAQGTTA